MSRSDVERLLATGQGSCTLEDLRRYLRDEVLGADDQVGDGWRFTAKGGEFIVEHGMVLPVRE